MPAHKKYHTEGERLAAKRESGRRCEARRRSENPERALEATRKWRAANPDANKNSAKKSYTKARAGETMEERARRLAYHRVASSKSYYGNHDASKERAKINAAAYRARNPEGAAKSHRAASVKAISECSDSYIASKMGLPVASLRAHPKFIRAKRSLIISRRASRSIEKAISKLLP